MKKFINNYPQNSTIIAPSTEQRTGRLMSAPDGRSGVSL